MIKAFQPFNLPAGRRDPAGALEGELPHGGQGRRGTAAQARQAQGHRRAAALAEFQRAVHFALVGKGEGELPAPRRRGGRGLTVPKFQEIHRVPPLRQAGSYPPRQDGVGGEGIFHAVQNQQKLHCVPLKGAVSAGR